jgi:hypothetical protein
MSVASNRRRERLADLANALDARRSCKNSLLRRPYSQFGWSRPRGDFPPCMSHRPFAISNPTCCGHQTQPPQAALRAANPQQSRAPRSPLRVPPKPRRRSDVPVQSRLLIAQPGAEYFPYAFSQAGAAAIQPMLRTRTVPWLPVPGCLLSFGAPRSGPSATSRC